MPVVYYIVITVTYLFVIAWARFLILIRFSLLMSPGAAMLLKANIFPLTILWHGSQWNCAPITWFLRVEIVITPDCFTVFLVCMKEKKKKEKKNCVAISDYPLFKSLLNSLSLHTQTSWFTAKGNMVYKYSHKTALLLSFLISFSSSKWFRYHLLKQVSHFWCKCLKFIGGWQRG